MSTHYRLPKMFTNTRWDFSLDLVDVDETEPAILTVGGIEYPATINDSAYNWTVDVDLEPGDYAYHIYTSVPLLYGRVEVK